MCLYSSRGIWLIVIEGRLEKVACRHLRFGEKKMSNFLAVLNIWYCWNRLFKLFPLVLHTWFCMNITHIKIIFKHTGGLNRKSSCVFLHNNDKHDMDSWK